MRKNVVCGGDVPLRLALYGSRALMRAVMSPCRESECAASHRTDPLERLGSTPTRPSHSHCPPPPTMHIHIHRAPLLQEPGQACLPGQRVPPGAASGRRRRQPAATAFPLRLLLERLLRSSLSLITAEGGELRGSRIFSTTGGCYRYSCQGGAETGLLGRALLPIRGGSPGHGLRQGALRSRVLADGEDRHQGEQFDTAGIAVKYELMRGCLI